MALVRTDYGLIYNTDGSLCATLLPEGGVAVTEGTTNIIDPKPEAWSGGNGGKVEKIDLYKMRVTNPTGGQWARGQSSSFTVGNGETVTISGYIEGYAGYVTFLLRDITSGSARINLVIDSVGYYHGTWTNDLGNDIECQLWLTVYGEYNPDGQQYIIADKIKAEKKPYDTPFVDGTRPAGALSYSSLLVAGKNEVAILMKLTKPQLLQTPWSHHALAIYRPTFTPLPDSFVLFANNGTNELRFRTRDSEGLNQDDIRIENCWDDDEHLVVAYMNHNPASGRHKKELYFDGELVGYSDPAGLPDLSNVQDVRLGHWDSSSFWGTPITMFCIKPTCTPEMVKTWHSLNAPFYDPREHIDAESTPIHMHNSEIKGHGHTVRDQYGNKAVFSGVDPDTGDRGYKVYGPSTNEEVAFLGVRGESGERGFFMRDPATGITWLSPSSIQGDRIAELPWDSLSDLVRVLATVTIEGNFILPNMDGSYGFDFIQESGELHQYIFKSTADTYTEASYPELNWGNATAMRVNNEAYYPTRTKFSYVKFGGLSSIPDTEEALDMELRLYYIDAASDLYHVVAIYGYNWSESTLRWNNCPVAQGGPDYLSNIATFNPKKGWVSIRDPRMVSEFNKPQSRDKIINTGFRIYALPHHSNHDFYPQMYTREKGSNYAPTLIVYTRDTQTLPTLDLYVPGGIVFLNRRIFEVSGKILTFPANRSDITIYVYENSSRVAEIDFAHGERAFKADSCVILGAAKTSSNAITEISKARNTGRKEGPRGMGNDVYYFDPIDIDTTAKNLTIPHELGGSRHQVEVEINPTGTSDWFRFSTAAYVDGSNKRGISVRIDSTNLYLDAGSTSVFGYINTAGNPVYVNSAKVRGRIVRLD